MKSWSCRSLSRCWTRSNGSGSSYLPDELIFTILSRTCVLTLLRCRSVCKSWLSIISNPEFIKAHHINISTKLPSILIITSRIDDEEYVEEPQWVGQKRVYGRRAATIVDSNEDSSSLPLMPPFDDDVEYVSSCNGIVCVSDRNDNIYLLNPLTRSFKKLPPLNGGYGDVVFGFDRLSCDFKVLKITYDSDDDDDKFVDVVAVHLYSSNADSWRVIEVGIELPSIVCYPFCLVLRSGPVLDGVLYLEGIDVIVTFDLHNELFGLIKYPSFMHTRKSSVLDFEGSVALVIESVSDGSLDEKEVSLWTMEAVSDEVFWNKMFTFNAASKEIDWVFLYTGADKFFGRTELGTVLYDFRKNVTTNIELPSPSFLVKALKHSERFLSVE